MTKGSYYLKISVNF